MNSDVVPVIAAGALVLVAAALLCAGLYALFGNPTTRGGKKRKQRVVNGFRIGGGILLGIILMATLVGGSQIAFGIVQSAKLSRIAGFCIGLGSLALIFAMIRLWAKHFAGWIGYSVWNGLLMVSSGHLVNNPSILIPRWLSISATALALVSAVICVRFTKTYLLNRADKAALIAWVLAFTLAVDVESTRAVYREQLGLGAMFFGCLALVVAWWYDRVTRHRHHPRLGQIHRLTEQSD